MNLGAIKLGDAATWAASGFAMLALIVSSLTYYDQSIREEHDFRAIALGDSVLLVNGGNRAEALVSARYLYSSPDWKPGDDRGVRGKSAPSLVLKPGEAQLIALPETKPDDFDPPLRSARHVAIDFLIVDTRSRYQGTKVFRASTLGFTIVRGGNARPGPFDTRGSIQLYDGVLLE